MGFQHLFRRHSTARQKEKDDVTETYKSLIDARFDRLESSIQLLRTEWADVHEKIMLLYDRNRKRLKAIEKASGREEAVERDPVVEHALNTNEDVLALWKHRNGM